jgi:hypothetical protein
MAEIDLANVSTEEIFEKDGRTGVGEETPERLDRSGKVLGREEGREGDSQSMFPRSVRRRTVHHAGPPPSKMSDRTDMSNG